MSTSNQFVVIVVAVVLSSMAIIIPLAESSNGTAPPMLNNTNEFESENFTQNDTNTRAEVNTNTNNSSTISNNTNTNSTVNNDTTLSPPLTTAKPATTTPKTPTPALPRTLDNFFCLCDDHFNFCDLDCCCDPDCSDAEKSVFSTCSFPAPASSRRQRSCRKFDYFFRNNTPFLMERTKNGLFCIAYDNYKEEEEMSVPKFLPGKIQKTSKYKWFSTVTKLPKRKLKSEPYKYRSRVKTVEVNDFGEHIGYFELPSSIHGHECSALAPTLFLEDSTEICFQQVFNFTADCEKVKNFNANTFIKNRLVGNHGKEFTEDNLILIIPLICESVLNCTQTMSIDDPYFDGSSTCVNVLRILDLTFVHNGVEGIEDVIAKVFFANYSTEVTGFTQEFVVNFVWKQDYTTGDDNETAPVTTDFVTTSSKIPKSGNPGYIDGKPVVMGVKVLQDQVDPSSGPNRTRKGKPSDLKPKVISAKEEVILLNIDSRKWMTVLGPGVCKSDNRKSVLFGLNINTMCIIDVTEDMSCQELQIAIGTVLLGVPPVNFTNRYVSSFGNPNFANIKDWVPVLTSESPFGSAQNSFSLADNGCDGITTSMHIQIAYAYVGSVQFPQAAILGVLYEFGQSTNLRNKTVREEQNHLSISTTVGFADVTGSPITKIAEWPTLSIQLPPDFFYPFSNSVPVSCKSCQKVFGVILPLVVLLFSY